MMKYKMFFLGCFIFLSGPVSRASDGAAGHFDDPIDDPINDGDSGNGTPTHKGLGEDHTWDGFEGTYLHHDDYPADEGDRVRPAGWKDNSNYVGNRPGETRLPTQATIDPISGDGTTSTVVHHVTDVLGQVAVRSNAPTPVLSGDLQESQVQLKKLIATAAEATQKLLTFPEGSKNILLAMRVLEILKTLENHVEMKNRSVLKTVGLTEEFAQAKLLLENGINNKRIALALKIQDLYKKYAAKGDQKNAPFSKTFKDQVSALFVEVPSQFEVQDKENNQNKDFFTFQDTIRDLLQSPMTPKVRASFRATLYAELTSGLGKEGDFKSQIEALQSVNPVFKKVFEVMDAQDAALEKQLRSTSRKQKSGQEMEPVSKPVPEGTYELFQAFQKALRYAGILKGSLMPEENAVFKERITSLPAKKEQLKDLAQSADNTAQRLQRMVTIRDALDAKGEGYQQADLQVKKLSIALKTSIEMHAKLKSEIDNDQTVIRDAFLTVEKVAEDRVITLSRAELKSVGKISDAVRQEINSMTKTLADKADDQLAVLKKQLITQQATDFVNNKGLVQQVDGFFNSPNRAACKVICEAVAFRDFSMEEALQMLDDDSIKEQLKKVSAFVGRVQSEFTLPGFDSSDLRQNLNQVIAANREAFAVECDKGAQVLNYLKYPTVDDYLAGLKKGFAKASARALELMDNFPTDPLPELEKSLDSFTVSGENTQYDRQNELYEVLGQMAAYRNELSNIMRVLPYVHKPIELKTNSLATFINDFNKGVQGWKPLTGNVKGGPESPEIQAVIKEMVTPAYVKKAPVSEAVRKSLAVFLGKELLKIPLSISEIPTGYRVSTEDAAVIKNLAVSKFKYPSDFLIDWQNIPKDFLQEVGEKWLETAGNEKGNLVSWHDKKMLADAWTKALQANRPSGDGGQPFRDIAVIAFGTPLDEVEFFKPLDSETLSVPLDEIGTLEKLSKKAGELYSEGLEQKYLLDQTLLDYKTFLAVNVGQARNGVAYLSAIANKVAMLEQKDGLTVDDLPSMISDIGAFQQALSMGEKSWWQQDLMDRSTAVKEALSCLVTAHTVTDLVALDKQLLVDLQARLEHINQLLLFPHNTLTTSDVSELHQWASIEPIEKELFNLINLVDKEEILSQFDRFDQRARDQLLPTFEEVSALQKEKQVFSKNKK